jgi:hypothetical protein
MLGLGLGLMMADKSAALSADGWELELADHWVQLTVAGME